jgi:hypothetical protein
LGNEPISSRTSAIWFRNAPAKTNIKNLLTIYIQIEKFALVKISTLWKKAKSFFTVLLLSMWESIENFIYIPWRWTSFQWQISVYHCLS